MSESPPDASTRIRRLIAQRLESLHSAGVEQLRRLEPLPLAARTEPEQPATAKVSAAPAASGSISKSSTPTVQPESAAPDERLRVLATEVQQCTKCSELADSRTQTVFGVGNPQPRLCFLGEAPGRDEDRQGEPFVGAAGQLLTKIIQAMTLQREDVYILNVLKCRPPGNRNPEADEISNCRPFFERQLEILNPEFICCLGAFAAKTLLDTDLSVGRMRGKFYRYGEARVVVTYHPAYLLRNESAKRSTWEDIKMLMEAMSLER